MPEATRRAAVLGLLALGACQSSPPPQRLADITFSHLPPFALDVATVEFVERFVAPLEPPHVESQFVVTPAGAARRWVEDRLAAAGTGRTARATLLDASATEHALATQGGVSGFFTDEQDKRYDVALDMLIEIIAPDGRLVEAHVRASAGGSTTVAEAATLDERDGALHRLTEEVIQALDRELDAGIRRHLADYLL
ncbi:MAG: hypothetical protein ACREER_01040 [Alphaproteobacteria bacterium]